MNRKEFLKKSYHFLSGSLIAGAGILNKKLLADIDTYTVFSIDVVTDNPELAIQKIERLVRSSFLNNYPIDFRQYQLAGNHIGDIVFVAAGKLVDFYNQNDAISNKLKETAKVLSLPQPFVNPTLLRFFSGMREKSANTVNIFKGNVLIEKLAIKDNTPTYRANGENGYIDVAVKDGLVKIVSASCKHKTCMELGAISRSGQSLVCIPNQLQVVIEGGNNFSVDGITF